MSNIDCASILNLLKELLQSTWLTPVTNVITILGVVMAFVVSWLWKHNYSLQKANEYALSILKQITSLHNAIEELRAPRFCNPKTIDEEIDSRYIPEIQLLVKQVLSIQSDLIIAKIFELHRVHANHQR